MLKTFSRYRLIALYLTFGLLTISSCSKDENAPITENDNLIFESFVFEAKNNSHLSEDIIFNIEKDELSGELKKYFYKSIPTFTTNASTVEIDNSVQVSGSNSVDFRSPIIYTLKSESGEFKTYPVNISWDDALVHIYIDTEGGAPIVSKDDYLNAKLRIDGQSKYEDRVFEFNEKARIKGRGNSTWGWPKKPYKIKLDTKETLLSDKDPLSRLLPEKSWVLLADYQDGVHLLNNIAFTIGRMLEMPFTNTIIPVEVSLNGDYLGLYGLTEQIEVKTNRVNVGDSGVLLELEQYYDEDWKFRSAAYNLPVMVKDPELESHAELDVIQSEWNTFEALVASENFPNNNYLDYIDGESVANYFIVYMLTSNEEINHPKSTYIHKEAGGKYVMGPIWDFDWAYGYEGSGYHFRDPETNLFWSGTNSGTLFFKKLMLSDPKIKALIKESWLDFTTNHLEDLMDHIEEQAFIIQGAKARNRVMWERDLVTDELIMKRWIEKRVTSMNILINSL